MPSTSGTDTAGAEGRGGPPIAWPRYVRWLAVAYVLSLVVGPVGFFVTTCIAAVLYVRSGPAFTVPVVVAIAVAGSFPAGCAAFRWWFRNWGRRRWPEAVSGAANPDASPDEPVPIAGLDELPEPVHERVRDLCRQGDAFAEQGLYSAALAPYWAAWELLPEPRSDWQAGTWILGSIGDANFLAGDFAAGRDNLSLAMHGPDAIGNPFLHLRLGQCLYETGDLDRAADELTRAYLGGGADLFDGADRYLSFLKTRIEPPPGGW